MKVYEFCNIYGDNRFGRGVKIGAYSELSGCTVGNYVTIGARCFIPKGIILEDNVWVGPSVIFCNDKYPPSSELNITRIGCGAMIGAAVVVLPGITIGAGAIIGAGSVVTQDIPANETWVGNPARKLR